METSPDRTSAPLASDPVGRMDGLSECRQDEPDSDVVLETDEIRAELVRERVELAEKRVALEETQQLLSSVLAAIGDVVVVCDLEGRILSGNRTFERLTGLSGQALTGRPLASLVSADSVGVVAGLARGISHGSVQDCELRLRADPEDVPLTVSCTSRYDARGCLVGMLLVGRPDGQLRRVCAELERTREALDQAQGRLVGAEKMASLGRLVAGVAHELNNPISFVYGNAQTLVTYRDRLVAYCEAVDADVPSAALRVLKDELEVGRLLKDLNILLRGILEGSRRMSELALDLRRFSSGQVFERVPFDLVHVVRTAVHWVSKMETAVATVELDLPERLEVKGHGGQIHQVVMNLVQNAMDAVEGAATPRIRVRLASFQDVAGTRRVRLLVEDNGTGIADSDLPRVFDAFFTTKPVERGTGLGLSISHGIASAHGGTLTAVNRPEGGACFTLELPA